MRKPVITRRDMIYNGFTISDYMVIERIERGSVIDIASFFSETPGKNGQQFLGSKRGAKQINVEGRIFGHEWQEIEKTASMIASKIHLKKPAELKLRDSILTDLAILDGSMGIVRVKNTALIKMTFTNPSGLRYGDAYKVNVASGQTVELFNGGTEDADLLISGSISQTTAEIMNVDTGERMGFVDLKTGEQIKLNSFEMSCIGESARKGMALDAAWVKLHPGGNRIKITGLNIAIEWRDTWM